MLIFGNNKKCKFLFIGVCVFYISYCKIKIGLATVGVCIFWVCDCDSRTPFLIYENAKGVKLYFPKKKCKKI